MAFYLLLLLALSATVKAEAEDTQPTQARQFTYNSQYPVDLQYEFSLLNPQLQYPPFSGGAARIQPHQVFIYPGGGAPGQPFLLQPGAPPGNFLIPQPQPGFVLRDVPAGRPNIFGSEYPKPAYVPPINKDAEEIPTNPGAVQPQMPSVDKKPEKLETFDEKPETERPFATEADVLAAADRTIGRTPPLKPGHRFFILNGQPLFSNYPLPQFANSPYQPTLNTFEPVDREFYTLRQNRPPFLPEGFSKLQHSDTLQRKVPVGSFFIRNSVTGQINGAKEQGYENPQSDIGSTQNFISLNQRDQPTSDILFKNLPPFPYKNQNLQQESQTRTDTRENLQDGYFPLRLNPIQVPNFDDDSDNLDDLFRKDKESVTISAKPEPDKPQSPEGTPAVEKSVEPSISRSQPTALALAGPGGVAAAAPRGTALTGDKGVSVSSPRATAIAGPSRDQIKEQPKLKSEQQ